jgi:hypothetical protein
MSEKIKISIYKKDEDVNIDDILSYLTKVKYSKIELLQDEKNDFKLNLYYNKRRPSIPNWKDFLKWSWLINEAKSKEILKYVSEKWWNESFVFIFSNSINTYFVTWWQWHNVISLFIQDDFWMDILSRLITEDEHILRAVKEKYLVWWILWSSKFFRKNYNFLENESFWKIYNELKANLDKDIIKKYFWFNAWDLNCIATNSFTLNKYLDFNELFYILNWCENIIKDLPPKIIFNSVEKIIKNRNSDLLTYLQNWLIEKIKQEDHYLCHDDFEKYLSEAKKYKIYWDTYLETLEFYELERISNILNKILGDWKYPDIIFNKILNLSIVSYDENDEILTEWKLINHIIWEYELLDKEFEKINEYRTRRAEKKISWKSYFFIDWNWFIIKDKFLEDLDNKCWRFINNNYVNWILHKKWEVIEKTNWKWKKYKTFIENQFNSSFFWENNFIVLDKVIVNEIEICDILKYDSDNLYLIHVKKWFDQNIRDLTNQIFISSSRILHDKANGFSLIWDLYDEIISKKTSTDTYFKSVWNQIDESKFPKSEFIKLFNKNIIYVLAFMDEWNRDIKACCIEDTSSWISKFKISEYSSNIAKFSLNNLILSMKDNDSNFIITQIFNNK